MAQRLRAARAPATLARTWTPQAEQAFLKLPASPSSHADEFAKLKSSIEEYRQVPEAKVSAETLKLLRGIFDQTVALWEAVKDTDAAAKEALEAVKTLVLQEEDLAKYRVQRAATGKAFATGVPPYVNITPQPGGREALASGDKGRYPENVPLEQQFRIGAPIDAGQDLDVDITGPGGEIDLLVVSGGHGGVGQLFEGATIDKHLEEDWWKKQAEALAAKKVTAKLIVLDACLTASMVPAFVPLLAAGGKIVGYVHSIPEMTMTGEVWAEVVGQGPSEIEKLVEARLQALVKRHGDIRHGTPLEPTIAIAIYRADRQALHYDVSALDAERLKTLPTLKEQRELEGMARTLGERKEKAKAMTGYSPSLRQAEGGTAAVKAGKTVTRDKWGEGWLDGFFMPMDDTSVAPDVDDVLTDLTRAKWKVVAADTNSFTVEPDTS